MGPLRGLQDALQGWSIEGCVWVRPDLGVCVGGQWQAREPQSRKHLGHYEVVDGGWVVGGGETEGKETSYTGCDPAGLKGDTDRVPWATSVREGGELGCWSNSLR